jgi:hypothetical protein
MDNNKKKASNTLALQVLLSFLMIESFFMGYLIAPQCYGTKDSFKSAQCMDVFLKSATDLQKFLYHASFVFGVIFGIGALMLLAKIKSNPVSRQMMEERIHKANNMTKRQWIESIIIAVVIMAVVIILANIYVKPPDFTGGLQ